MIHSLRCALAFVLLVLVVPASLPAAAERSKAQAARPLKSLLNADGTLNISTGYAGSLDASGWEMALGSHGEPRFVSAGTLQAAGDEKWDDRFGLLGVQSSEVRAIAASGPNVYVGGSLEHQDIPGSNSLLRWDGRRWHAVGGGVQATDYTGGSVTGNGQVHAIAISGSRVYVGGFFSRAGDVSVSNIAMWDGTRWSAMGGGIRAGGSLEGAAVHALAVTNGELYVGGRFDSAGGVEAQNIARWNEAQQRWSALGSGMRGDIINPQGSVYALAASGSTIYAGGQFGSAGGRPAANIARWNGSAWSAVGGGVTGSTGVPAVYALALDGTTLYVGGRFDQAGSVSAANIARWNGSAWSAFGSGIGGMASGELPVQALTVRDGQVYVGGRFTTAGGVPARSLARWDGTRWAELGGSVDGDAPNVFALRFAGTDLYAGGDFLSIGSRWLERIGRWDGDEWRSLGQGVHVRGGGGTVSAVAVNARGEVFVGGTFEHVGETPANNVAKWDGTRWWNLGSGTDTSVFAIAIAGDDVYVGGYFNRAGDLATPGVARWNDATRTWSALGTGVPDRVNTLAIGGRWLYAGAGVAIGKVARWNLDTQAWVDVQGSFDSPVHSLVTRGDFVYIGGNFDKLFLPDEVVIVGGLVVWDTAGDNWY